MSGVLLDITSKVNHSCVIFHRGFADVQGEEKPDFVRNQGLMFSIDRVSCTIPCALWALCLFYLLCTSGCTNNLSKLYSVGTGGITGAPPNTGSQPDSGAFTLSRVLFNVTSGTANMLDLVGDGSGAFGNLCAPTGGAASSDPEGGIGSPCSCTFAFSTATVPNIQIDVPVLYQETNLLRCSAAQIPSSTSSVQVSIHLNTAGSYSNQVKLNLTSSGMVFDSSNPSNFVSPIRYQCRDIINVFYMLDSSMYDPFQSEDPHLTFPLDFYTIDLGLAAQAYIDAFTNVPGLEYWNCPAILNPSLYLLGNPDDTTSPISVYNSNNYMNMKIYSKAPLMGDNIIYPPSGQSQDRSTFYIASSPGGVFTVPVNALLAPAVTTSSTAVTQLAKAPLGYGASPIPIGFGTSTESCPDTSVTIPPGFHWMKLWLFRASLPQRSSKTSTAITTKIQSITCNPGDWAYDTNNPPDNAPALAGCYAQKSSLTKLGWTAAIGGGFSDDTNFFYSLGLNDVNNTSVYLADRVLGNNQCVRLQNPNTTTNSPCGTGAVGTGSLPGPACDTIAGDASNTFDVWQVELPFLRHSDSSFYNPAFNKGCGKYTSNAAGAAGAGIPSTADTSQAISDPFNLCQPSQLTGGLPVAAGNDAGTVAFGAASSASGLTQGSGIIPVISDYNDIQTQAIDKGGSRFDFLYVVSPPSVTVANMQDTSSSAVSLAYQPMRFKLESDCLKSDPGDPSCSSSNLITYDMKLHDIGSNGDPPGNDPNRPGTFPICVLQPN